MSKNIMKLVSAVDGVFELRDQNKNYISKSIGASALGHECNRYLAMKFRWLGSGEQFKGRMLRLFARGDREEFVFEEILQNIGAHTISIDPRTGGQFNARFAKGHGNAYNDGIITNLSQWLLGTADDEPMLAEYKTYSDKRFKTLTKQGVENSDPKYFDQMIIYMDLWDLKHALFCAVNKNTDELYFEYVAQNKERAKVLHMKADSIVETTVLPPRKGNAAHAYVCKFCEMAPLCHYETMPDINCRTCAFSTAEEGGRWTCANPAEDFKVSLSPEYQKRGCGNHVFNPDFITNKHIKYSSGDSTLTHAAWHVMNTDVVIMNGPHNAEGSDHLVATSEEFAAGIQSAQKVVK